MCSDRITFSSANISHISLLTSQIIGFRLQIFFFFSSSSSEFTFITVYHVCVRAEKKSDKARTFVRVNGKGRRSWKKREQTIPFTFHKWKCVHAHAYATSISPSNIQCNITIIMHSMNRFNCCCLCDCWCCLILLLVSIWYFSWGSFLFSWQSLVLLHFDHLGIVDYVPFCSSLEFNDVVQFFSSCFVFDYHLNLFELLLATSINMYALKLHLLIVDLWNARIQVSKKAMLDHDTFNH